MLLEKYKQKRRFSKTPEPEGDIRKSDGALTFVVQKHEASRLHYDFRLELDGVLKSWAVPKGPSMNPQDKRLAMMVEDHPYDYKDFEGIIPKGNYGAGTVMVWDNGVYTSLKNPKYSEHQLKIELHRGHLEIVLLGKKLKGAFDLVKIKNSGEPASPDERASRGGENAWLLIKREDEYAINDKGLKINDKSVKTGRTMEEIADNKDAVWSSNKELNLDGLPKKDIRRPVDPMKAILGKEPFDGKEWIFEVKWDGYRAIAEIGKNKIQLYSRNQISYNKLFEPIVKELKKIKQSMVLDGEVVILDSKGRANFQLLQNYASASSAQARHMNLVYYIFDILYFDGHDLTSLPLVERKEILQRVLPQTPSLKLSEHIEEAGTKFYKAVREQGVEGIIAKKSDSKYEIGRRSSNWIKIKTKNRQEAIIAGFTQPRGGRKLFGALVLGLFENGKLRYIGHTGGGFGHTSLSEVYEKLKPLETPKCPFPIPPKTNTPATWVKPQLIAEIEFSEWTGDGIMRQPIFLGLREDKDPKEVVREDPKTISNSQFSISKQNSKLKNQNEQLEFTNLTKIFFPKDKITKGDLIEYYKEVSKFILPHLKDRPHSLLRYPNGITKSSFFQKNIEDKPDFIETVTVTSDSEERDVHYLVCKDEQSFLYMVQLGCIDMHPWFSTVQNLEKPTYCVIDLDPEEVEFEKVVEAALESHKFLDQLKVENYIKTSGATGLHIYIPLGNKYTYDQSKTFAELIANIVHKKIPKFTSVERMPDKRKGKVYLDFLQNRVGQTLASPYSVRPRPGAFVSTPLHWDEVNKKLKPSMFTIGNIKKRLEKEGDLFKPTLGKGIDMEKALSGLTSK